MSPKEIYIGLETAKLAKLKGFDWRCGYKWENVKSRSEWGTGDILDTKDGYNLHCDRDFGMYAIKVTDWNHATIYFDGEFIKIDCFSAPSQSILQKWLREVHKLRVFVTQKVSGGFAFDIFNATGEVGRPWNRNSFFFTKHAEYEEALEIGLQEALKMIGDESDSNKQRS